MNHPVRPSVHISRKSNSQTDEPILMRLYTVVVYNLRMWMKDYNPGLKIVGKVIQGR